MKRVLLTGASGFIGSHCISPLLERGYEIFAISSKPQAAAVKGLHWVEWDFKNEAGFDERVQRISPSHFLHLAWYVEPPHFWDSLENLRWLRITLSLLEAFYKSGGTRALFTGTCAEYDWDHGECFEDETPCKPASLYGAAKHSLFLLSQKLAAQINRSFAWARFFHLYGSGEHPRKLIRSAISTLLEGGKMVCSNGDLVRDYLHVADAGEALASLLDSSCEGAFNVGSGTPLKIRDILNAIGKKIGGPERIEYSAARKGEPLLLVPSLKKIQRAIHWKSKIGIEAGIDQMIEILKNTPGRSSAISGGNIS